MVDGVGNGLRPNARSGETQPPISQPVVAQRSEQPSARVDGEPRTDGVDRPRERSAVPDTGAPQIAAPGVAAQPPTQQPTQQGQTPAGRAAFEAAVARYERAA